MIEEVITRNVLARMNVLGLSKAELSTRPGCKDALRNLKRGGAWTLRTLERVAAALQMTPVELLTPPPGLTIDKADAPRMLVFLRMQRALYDQQIEALESEGEAPRHRRKHKGR